MASYYERAKGGASSTTPSANTSYFERAKSQTKAPVVPDVISKYESIPNYNIFERTFNEDKRKAYNEKQSLLPEYEAQKSNVNANLLASIGLTADDVTRKGPSSSNEDKRITQLLQSKGLSQKQINDMKKYGAVNLQKKTNENLNNFTDDHWLLGTGVSSLLKPGAAIAGTITNTYDYLTGKPLSNTSEANALTKTVGDMRDTASKDFGNVGKFAYGVGTSMVDMIPTLAMGIGYAGASAMQDSMANNIDRGLTPNQIYLTSLASGIAEAALEKIPLGKLEKLAKGIGVKEGKAGIVQAILSSMGAEAIEEGGTDIANAIADRIINGDKSELNEEIKAYESQGMSHEDALQKAMLNFIQTVGMDALAGAVSGGAMGLGAMGVGKLKGAYNELTNFNLNNMDSAEANEQVRANAEANRQANIDRANELNARANRLQAEQNTNDANDLTNLMRQFNENEAREQAQRENNIRDARVLPQLVNRINEEQNANAQPNLTELLQQASQIPNKPNTVAELVKETKPSVDAKLSELGANLPEADRAKMKNVQHAIDTYFETGKLFNVQAAYIEVARNMSDTPARTELALYLGDLITEQIDNPNSPYGRMDDLQAEKESNRVQYPRLENQVPLRTEPTYSPETFANPYIPKLEQPKPKTKAKAKANANANANGMSAIETSTTEYTENLKSADNEVNVTPSSEGPIAYGSDVPKSEVAKDNTDNSQTAKNSFTRSNVFQKAQESIDYMEDGKKNGKWKVDKVTERESVEEAQRLLDNDYEGEVDRLLHAPELSGVAVDESMGIMDRKVDEAIKSGDWTDVDIWSITFNDKIHNVAQALQALAKYTRSAPGVIAKTQALVKAKTDKFTNKKSNSEKVAKNQRLANALAEIKGETKVKAERVPKNLEQTRAEVVNTLKGNEAFAGLSKTEIDYLSRLVEKGASKTVIASKLNQYLATGSFGLNSDQMQKITDIFNKLEKMDKPNSKEAVALEKEAYAIAAESMGAKTFMEKWNALRYLAMLGNTRTHIRNIIGNTAFGIVTDLKDNVAAIMEEAVDKASRNGIERTKSVLTSEDSDLVKASADYFDTDVYALATDDGGKFNLGNEIEQARRTFKSKSVEKFNQFNGDMLTKEDDIAIKRKFKKALAGYLKANNADASIFKSTKQSDIDLLQKATKYAIEQAQIATFHEKNAVAELLQNWSRAAEQNGSAGGKALNVVLEALIPFKKTPANILKQGALEYNPVYQLGNIIAEVARGDSASTIIDSTAKGLTGGSLLALGVLGAMSGIVRGGSDDDSDELFGEQEYSINWGNGNSYTVDWLAPAALPLFMGVELYKAIENDGFTDASEVMNALASITEPIIELSMLDGLKNTLNTAANTYTYDRNSLIPSTVASIGMNYVSQAVPTLGGQITRATQENRKNTRANTKGTIGTIEKQARKIANKIPVLSNVNEDYLNAWGEEQKNTGSNFATRLAYNMLSPGYYSNTSKDKLENEIDRLHKVDKDANIIPKLADNSYKGERLDNETYFEFAQATGKNASVMLGALIESPDYKRLTDSQKATAMENVLKFSRAYSKKQILNYAMEDSSTYKSALRAYTTGGVNGLIAFYCNKERNKIGNNNDKDNE